MSKATNGYLYSWHILKDFQYKSAKFENNKPDYASGDSNTSGLAGANCKCGTSLEKEQYTISAICTVATGEALYFALTGNSTAIKGTQSGTTWSSTVSGSVTTFYVYKGPASLDDFVDINNTSLVCSTESFSIDETANPIFPTPVTLTATYTCAAGEALYFTGTFEGANNNATAFKGTQSGSTWTFDTYGFDKMTWKVLKGKDSLGDEVTIAGSSLLSMKGSVSYPTIKTTPVFPTPVTLTATYSGCKTGENIYFSGNFHGAENGTVALKGTQSGSTWTLTVTADTDTFNWYVLKGKNTSSAVANSGLLKMNENAETAPTVKSIANPTFPEGRIAVTCTSGLSSTEAIYFAGTFDDGSTSKAVKGTKDSTGKWYLDVTFAGKGKSFTWSVYKGSSSYTSANVSSLTPAQGTNSFTGVGTQTVTFPTATYIYFKPDSKWASAGARFAAYFYNETTNTNKWVSMTEGSDGIYYCKKQSGYPNVIFVRMNPETTDNNWDNKWNQTADLTIPTNGNNYFILNNCPDNKSWDGIDGTWSKK